MPSTLTQRLSEYVAAAFTGLWVQSYEHEDALAEIARLCHEHKWPLAVWDVDRGLQVNGQAAENTGDPVAAIRAMNALATPEGSAILVLPNFHRFVSGAEVVQALAHQVHQGKQNRTFIVILSPVVQIPVELERQFVVVEHDLPDRSQLEEIARGIATEPGEMPPDADLARLLDAAAGLSRFEAEGAFSLSLVRHGRLEPDSTWELKTQALKKSGLLTLHRGGERFDDLGGLDAMKSFCKRALRPRPAGEPVRPRGILLLGVPGTGKSAFAKGLGNEVGRPTLHLDVGALMGSLVGQTEANVRQALRIADAMSPAILFCDEVEKALSGVASSGQTDSGVSARLFGSFLTWLNDHESDVFFIATCNDISKLPHEFSRAERFDGIFFLDLPDKAEKEAIWRIYFKKFGIREDQVRPDDADWTGAEIRSCCRLARLLEVSLEEAGWNVVPVAVTAAESVERLRAWAAGRCLSANEPGVYTRKGQDASRSRRRVSRGPSAN
jgi:SpoVK/Ycf46/Vps4 family AAA+-type ATPase